MPVNRDRAPALMREYHFDVIVTMTPENVTCLSDFPMLHGCLAEEERRLHAALRSSHTSFDLNDLRACLKAKGLAAGHIGFDEEALQSPDIFGHVAGLLPKAKVVPTSRSSRGSEW
ncbi:MAG: hypothetical protein ACHQ7N_20190 [Candidatus Methylomirabilales bacterium]